MKLSSNFAERRKQLMALLYIRGVSIEKMSAMLGYSPKYVTSITRSPLFKELAQELYNDLATHADQSVLQRIDDEAMPSLQRISEIRDGLFEDPARANVQLRAAEKLIGDLYMDRKHPKVTKQERDGEVVVSFPEALVVQMARAMADESGADISITDQSAKVVVDADYEVIDEARQLPSPSSKKKKKGKKYNIEAVSIDQLTDELHEEQLHTEAN